MSYKINYEIHRIIKKRVPDEGIDLKIRNSIKFSSEIIGASLMILITKLFQLIIVILQNLNILFLIWKNKTEVSFHGKYGNFLHLYVLAWKL